MKNVSTYESSDYLTLLHASQGRHTLAEQLRRWPEQEEAALAELIEVDGRFRIERGEAVDLAGYFRLVPGLKDKPVALDAAIDMTLRSMCGDGRPSQVAIETLLMNYPDLRDPIQLAAQLGAAVWTTVELEQHSAPVARPLPAAFGRSMVDGTPRYRLEVLVGTGNSASVYQGVDLQLSEADRPAYVAIKILSPLRPEEGVDRFFDEARIVRRIDHPNVARIIDVGLSEMDEVYIVGEYIDGGDLMQFVDSRGRAMAPRAAAELVASVARGMDAAHRSGVIHRDLKPSNIAVTGDGVPKVIDFGIAQRGSTDPASHSDASLERLGTLGFMAPEQYSLDEHSSDLAVDIYALGGVLYWLLTRRCPNGESTSEVRQALLSGAERPVDGEDAFHGVSIDHDLTSICRRSLARNPRERYATASALADDLEAWMQSRPIAWREPTISKKLSLWRKRNPLTMTLAGLFLVSAIAGFTLIKRQASEIKHVQTLFDREVMHRLRDLEDLRMMKRIQSLVTTPSLTGDQTSMLWRIERNIWKRVPASAHETHDLWVKQVDSINERLASRFGAGLYDDYQTQLLRSMKSLWMVHLNRADIATDQIVWILPFWHSLLKDGDPWLAGIDVVAACAEADRLLGRAGCPEVDDVDPVAAEAAYDKLLGALTRAQELEGIDMLEMISQPRLQLLEREGALDRTRSSP